MLVNEPQGEPIPVGPKAVDPVVLERPDLESFLGSLSAKDQQRFHDKVTRLHFGDAGLSYDDAVDVTMKSLIPNASSLDKGHQPTPDEILELWTDTPERAEQIAYAAGIAKKARKLHESNLAKTLADIQSGATSPHDEAA